MFRLLRKKPGLGIEISSSAVRLAAVSVNGAGLTVFSTKTADLPNDVLSATYASPNIHDPGRFADVLRGALTSVSAPPACRAALSLPDGVFRVQTLEFDELPGKAIERERLVRWRLEKSAFDVSDTVLRYQVLKRQDKGFSVLACAAKSAVISQYESLLAGLGLEPWSVGLSSFHSLNLYSPFISKNSPVFALAHVSKDSCATIVAELAGARFYRYKEVKRGSLEETTARLVREIGDSLHFYTHTACPQNGVGRLYLTGAGATLPGLADGLKDMTSLDVEALSLSVIAPPASGVGPELAAALGAGCGL
jgi:Tfp pilus assembly PilM family ATPase